MFEDAPAPAAPSRDNLVVGSKVKAYIKTQGKMSSGALISALSEKVHNLLDEACGRATKNGRKTVKDIDI